MATRTLDQPRPSRSTRARSCPARRRSPPSLIVLAAWYLNAAISWRQAALFLVGAGAGVVLYHAAFGFTSSWRVFISDRRGAGLRAQMLMLAITCAVFFPLLAAGTFFGQPLRGSVSPIGVGVAAGAFIFGLGMQLGGGCASGTLVQRRRRQHAHARHAVLLHHRLGDRHRAHGLVDGAAGVCRRRRS